LTFPQSPLERFQENHPKSERASEDPQNVEDGCLDSHGHGSLVTLRGLIQSKPFLYSESQKRRSSWFFLANSCIKTIGDLGNLEREREKFSYLERFFENWRESYSHKFVSLSKGDTRVFIKQYSRFDGEYRVPLRRKLKSLDGVQWDLKLELTIDPKRCMQYVHGFHLLARGWNRLNSFLKDKFRDYLNGKDDPRIVFDPSASSILNFKVLEITKAGRGHFHILISGITWIDQGYLSELWSSYGCGEIVYVKRVDSQNNLKASSYVMKYVNKTLSESDKRYSSVLFAGNRRVFSMSRTCQMLIPSARSPPKGFTYEGSVLACGLKSYCLEKNVVFAPYIRLDVDLSDSAEADLWNSCLGWAG